jgi:ferredoxin-nitrite reductase
MANPVEVWKAEKHGFDVWPDVLQYAADGTPMKQIEQADLERMKWHGVFYRKNDGAGTYMLRIRIPGCELTADQAKAVAYVAYEMGYGIVDVTTRANLQVQGLSIDKVPAALERLRATGLSCRQTGHDNIRNVFAHPFSGLDPEELIDTRELCRDVTALFEGSRDYSDLPRKMNIALNGRGEHSLHYWSQDISYLAHRDASGHVAFQVLIAGTQGQNPLLATHLPVLVEPEQVVETTRALLDLFRAQGSREKRDRARLRYLVERIGVHGVLSWLSENLPFTLQPCITPPPAPSGYEDLVGWFPQKQPGRYLMGLCVPLGRLTWQQLEGLAVAAKKWGDGTLRTTVEQGIALAGIPSGFRDAAATHAAGLGLSPHADSLVRNMVACTGRQFCNIAVTETKGHAFQLIEKLRQRAVTLHGIRIHMSGCPSSCAQHYTADIGLKGVRVRRLLGTREGFDVFLGGGVSGQVHLALPYKLGVDVDQLPQLVEEVIQEYYLRHQAGQTFSAYWREKLRDAEAAKVGNDDYLPPIWICETCQHKHSGEDPPVFCPRCAGLRRYFARIDADSPVEAEVVEAVSSVIAPDGYVDAAPEGAVEEGAGLTVEIGGRELLLTRIGGEITATDNACPHEGAALSQGEIADGVVSCPWHSWTFNLKTGCSIDPTGHSIATYPVKVESGRVFVQMEQAAAPAKKTLPPCIAAAASKAPALQTAVLNVIEVIDETPDTKTWRLDNSAGQLPAHLPGQFVKACVELEGREVWRSFTISSSPEQPHLDLTIKRNPTGELSNHMHDSLTTGGVLKVKGPQGGFYFDPAKHPEPLVLISAGSGITPMMCITRYLAAHGIERPCLFLHGARTGADIIFHEECVVLARTLPGFTYRVSLSQPPEDWPGLKGRLSFESVGELIPNLAECRYFLCGPNEFMDDFKANLQQAGVPADRIHTEEFQKSRPKVAANV